MEQLKLLFSVNNAAHALDCSRSSLYELMKAGLIKYVTFSNERRIPAEEVQRLATEGIPSIPKRVKKAQV
ncbi:helix-turn-helix domain-containing protein [Pseudomonas tussilaginis]|uniref:helix-turn-helix domain-containing protein n=1 Tax=Pseudomonas sp. 5 TaxID=1619949 RepID=UPI0005EB1AF6|nr:helix-turn-helix domain-containing protein [Pseudomonas sp. 5]KJK09317.1 hypothetical protein UB47_01890 [Pseudomonas sp. 5]